MTTQSTWKTRVMKNNGNPFDIEGEIVYETRNEDFEADPFIVGDYLFVETKEDKGVLSCIDLGTGNQKLIMRNEFHLSFPNVFKQGDYFMIPECGASGYIDIYHSKNLLDWEFKKTLVKSPEFGYADPILWFDKKYYLFFVGKDNDSLLIYTSDALLGEYKPYHVRRHKHSRPAGNLFEYSGKLYRPVQDCSTSYGKNVIIKEITLEPYTEKIVHEYSHDWLGMHTINFTDKYKVIDYKI